MRVYMMRRKFGLRAPARSPNLQLGTQRHLYRLTQDDHLALVERANGHCPICGTAIGRKNDEKRTAVIDHDHVTGTVRGLICDSCNVGLGRFNDDPALLLAAAIYLLAWRYRGA